MTNLLPPDDEAWFEAFDLFPSNSDHRMSEPYNASNQDEDEFLEFAGLVPTTYRLLKTA